MHAARYVPATIRSAGTQKRTGQSFFTPSITRRSVPAPLILPPALIRKSHNACISGSLAAGWITVSPSAKTAAKIRFSVTPTLTKGSSCTVPRSLPALAQNPSGPSIISTPMRLSAHRCWSMGRFPITQPPGYSMATSPMRASSAPRSMIEERITPTESAGMSHSATPHVSIRITSAFLQTRHPRLSSSRSIWYTSDISGQFTISQVPSIKSVAARIGSEAFFDPCIFVCPERQFPP